MYKFLNLALEKSFCEKLPGLKNSHYTQAIIDHQDNTKLFNIYIIALYTTQGKPVFPVLISLQI